jgi:hypothetical protein
LCAQDLVERVAIHPPCTSGRSGVLVEAARAIIAASVRSNSQSGTPGT